ncbi:MAG: hypothetical protein WAN31_02330, partial [Methylovirgula sp.]
MRLCYTFGADDLYSRPGGHGFIAQAEGKAKARFHPAMGRAFLLYEARAEALDLASRVFEDF